MLIAAIRRRELTIIIPLPAWSYNSGRRTLAAWERGIPTIAGVSCSVVTYHIREVRTSCEEERLQREGRDRWKSVFLFTLNFTTMGFEFQLELWWKTLALL